MTGINGGASDGFTLVELLASLTVLALASLLLLEGLGARGMAWARLDRDTAEGETLDAARMVIADRVQRLWPTTVYYTNPAGPDFEGHAGVMTFLAPPRDADGRGALRRYQLTLEANGDLVLASRSDLAIDQKRWTVRQVLVRGGRSLDLAFFGAGPQDPAPAWRSDWRDRGALPSLIRIRLGFAEGDRRRWPDLLARPVATIDADCHLLAATGRCRGR